MLFLEPADIFFAVTTGAVIVVTTILAWGGILLIRTLRDIQHISTSARKESDRIVADVDNLRSRIKKEGATVLHFFHSLGMLFSRQSKTKKKKK